jgi:DNA-directed RNA polymerase specialized sigma24 family protein
LALRPERPPDAQTVACPCRHGDVPAEIAGQRPLLERAAAGDREAFARLYDGQVEGVYRYLLAWTGDRATAAELTGQVFRGALGWLPVTAAGEGEVGAWLIAMARDAVAQRRGSGWIAGPAALEAPKAPVSDVVAAVARLGDPEREVVVLRLLLGHSVAHASHLSGYSSRAVMELQLAACLAVWQLTGGARADDPAAPTRRPPSAEDFERRLGRWEIDLTGSDPALADALAVAGSLRRAIPGYVVAPDDNLVHRLRQELLTAEVHSEPGPVPPADAASPGPVSRWGSVAGRRNEGDRSSTGRREALLFRRPWVSTGVAAAGIMVVLALQAFGGPAPPLACDGGPCPPSTTVTAMAADGGLQPPLTTVVQPSTTSSTVSALASAPADPQTTAATTPPTTRPATTAPPTTARPRPTTTRAPTTTAPTTTVATTTTVAPATT